MNRGKGLDINAMNRAASPTA
jgi:hypothetical protein